MRIGKSIIVYKKELLDILRDKKAVLMMVIIPIILYPLIFMLMSQMLSFSAKRVQDEKSIVAISKNASPRLIEFLKKEKDILVVRIDLVEEDLNSQAVHLLVDVTNQKGIETLKISYDGSYEQSQIALKRIEKCLSQYKDQVVREILKVNGIGSYAVDAVSISTEDKAKPQDMSSVYLSTILPMLLIVTIGLGAIYPSIDLTAGEKERGTLETILTVPIGKHELFLGKYMAVSTITILTAVFNLISMLLVYWLQTITVQTPTAQTGFTISITMILTMFVLIIPISLFITALTLSACLFAKSFKDAQNIVTPVYLLLMIPTLFSMTPGLSLAGVLKFIPVLNVSLAFRELFINGLPIDIILVVFFSNLLVAFLGYMMVLRFFKAEEILFSEGKGLSLLSKRSNIKAQDTFEPQEGILFAAVMLILIIYLASWLQAKDVFWGLLETQWLILFIPIIFSVWYFKRSYRKTLFIKKFSLKTMMGALVLGIGMFLLNIFVSNIIAQVFPGIGESSTTIQKLLGDTNAAMSPIFLYFVLAISPAICEELFFRGLLLSSFSKKFSPIASIVFVALLFGIFHLSIVKFIPVVIIGITLGYITLQGGSIFPSILVHSLSNAAVVTQLLYPSYAKKFEVLLSKNQNITILAIITVLTILGGAMVLHYQKKTSQKMMQSLNTK